MCTTGLCNAIYILTLCFFGWIFTGILISIRGTQISSNRNFLRPLSSFITVSMSNEILAPLNCFRLEIVNPVFSVLLTIARDWNKLAGSKPGIGKTI